MGEMYNLRNLFKFLHLFNLFFFCFVYANDISEKERELFDVQQQLEMQRRLVEEIETKRASAVQSKQQTQRQYNTIQSRITELNKTQQQLRNNLERTQQIKDETQLKLTKVQLTSNQALLYLLLTDQAETRLKMNENDNFFLSVYAKGLIKENKKLNLEITKMTTDNRNREDEIKKAITRSRDEDQN